MKKASLLLCIIISMAFPGNAQVRLYVEAFAGGNVSLSKFSTPAPRPGIHKYNKLGPFFMVLGGYRIGNWLYLESGLMKPVTGVKFKLNDPAWGGDYSRSYVTETIMIPLFVRRNYSINKQKYFMRLGGAFKKLPKDTFPDEISQWPASKAEISYRHYYGSDIYVCLIAGGGYTKRIFYKGKDHQKRNIGEFSISLLYAQGLTKALSQWVDYSSDGAIYHTHKIFNKGSFISMQLGMRLYSLKFRGPARHPWPSRKEID